MPCSRPDLLKTSHTHHGASGYVARPAFPSHSYISCSHEGMELHYDLRRVAPHVGWLTQIQRPPRTRSKALQLIFLDHGLNTSEAGVLRRR